MNEILNEKGHAWWVTTIEELVKVQLFFDSLKQDFVNIDKQSEYVIKKKHDILHFNWPYDTLFDKWMEDIASDEQLEEVEIDDDEVQEDELQVIGTLAQDQTKEEDKRKKSISVTSLEAQDADMTQEETRIKLVLSVHDENCENPQVENGLQVSK